MASPQFPGDDGAGAPEVRADLVRVAAGELSVRALARRLRDRRLFTGVVAVLDSMGEDGEEKDSHMAVVSMVSATGERGLLAFTGIDALTAWDPTARPVPALGRDVARAALEDHAHAVVLDVGGPMPAVMAGPVLRVLADDVDLAAVSRRVAELLAADLAQTGRLVVLDAGDWVARAGADLDPEIGDGLDADVVVQVPGAAAEAAARALGSDPVMRGLVPGGLAVVPSR